MRHMKQSFTPAIRPVRTRIYRKTSGKRSTPSVRRRSNSRDFGPATLMLAYAVVTGVTWICHSGLAVCSQFSIHSRAGGAGGGRRHYVTLRVETACHTVVEDHTVLEAHHTVADRADIEVVPPVDVQVVEQPGHLRAAQVELAKRRHVYDADVLADIENFGGRVAVVVGPDPGSCNERLRPAHLVPRLYRRVAHRLEHTSCQGAKGDRAVRGPPHGGPRLLDGATRGLRHDRNGVDGLELSLCRPHGHRRIPLDQFYRVVTLFLRGDDVFGGDILGVVHDAVRLAAEQRGMVSDRQLRDRHRR